MKFETKLLLFFVVVVSLFTAVVVASIKLAEPEPVDPQLVEIHRNKFISKMGIEQKSVDCRFFPQRGTEHCDAVLNGAPVKFNCGKVRCEWYRSQ